jgi:hypothetical protein
MIFRAKDPNPGQTIRLKYYGGPFVLKNCPAKINPENPQGPNTGLNATFSWTPCCNAIRYRPFMAVFRATDNHQTKPLSDISYWNIKVVGPSPKNVKIAAESNGIKITWDRDTCKMAFGYKIYRKVDSSFWKHGPCETGVPAYTKYTLYDTTKGVNNTTFFDNNGGRGISPLIRYCYIITSQYFPRNEDGTIILVGENTESYASEEVCEIILRTQPIITKVSVEKTAITDGKIWVNWIKPIVDSNQFKPPYQVQLFRANSVNGVYTKIGSDIFYPTFQSLADESYLDSNLNTVNNTYYYQVKFFSTRNSMFTFTEQSAVAGSVKLNLRNTNRTLLLNWKADVPWINNQSTVFRKNDLGIFDSIGSTKGTNFIDTGLVNGKTYFM